MAPRFQHLDAAAGLASCSVAVNRAGPGVAILPAGDFRANDGRPEEVAAWHLDADAAAAIAAAWQFKGRPILIDYEHQTLLAADNGQPAPAAGWVDPGSLSFDPERGLTAAAVEWTARAAAMLDAGEYRYLSPVFTYDPDSGAVTGLLHLALTNDPALDHGAEILAAATRFLSTQGKPPTEEKPMALSDAIRTALGLPEDATEEAAVAAVTALQAQAHDAGEQVAALKAAHDPAQFVPATTFEEVRAELAALKAELTTREHEALIAQGLADGRILDTMAEWARALDVAALRRYLDNAKPIAALKGTQTGGQPPQGAGDPATPAAAGERAAAAWDASPALQAELSRDAYVAFCKAQHAGQIKIRGAAA